MGGGLPRAYSKDYLQHVTRNDDDMRPNKYGGASNIVQAGRMESQKMLLERYNRIDFQDENVRNAGSAMKPKFIRAQNYYYNSNLKQNSSSVD